MVISVFFFILGLIPGSFINAFLYRYQGKKTMMGRSFCPVCTNQLAWYDNIPLVSWLLLSARCRYCKKAISVQYPLVEFFGGLITLLVAQKSGLILMLNNFIFNLKNFQLSTLLEFIILNSIFLVLLTISIYDIKHKEIPNGFNLTFILLAFAHLLITSVGPQYNILDTIYFILAAIAAFAFFYSIAYFSKETWMGGGDAKLAFGMGLLLGPAGIFLAILVASWLGSIYGLTMIILIRNSEPGIRKSHEIPFGPFLALGTLISFLFSSQMIQWYVKMFLGF